MPVVLELRSLAHPTAASGPGPLPDSLPVSATSIDFSDEYGYTGTIPTEFGLLTNATTVNLWNNQLEGAVPTEIGQLSNVLILFFDHNKIVGPIPTGERSKQLRDSIVVKWTPLVIGYLHLTPNHSPTQK